MSVEFVEKVEALDQTALKEELGELSPEIARENLMENGDAIRGVVSELRSIVPVDIDVAKRRLVDLGLMSLRYEVNAAHIKYFIETYQPVEGVTFEEKLVASIADEPREFIPQSGDQDLGLQLDVINAIAEHVWGELSFDQLIELLIFGMHVNQGKELTAYDVVNAFGALGVYCNINLGGTGEALHTVYDFNTGVLNLHIRRASAHPEVMARKMGIELSRLRKNRVDYPGVEKVAGVSWLIQEKTRRTFDRLFGEDTYILEADLPIEHLLKLGSQGIDGIRVAMINILHSPRNIAHFVHTGKAPTIGRIIIHADIFFLD